MKRKLSWHFYVVLLIVASIAITVNAFFVKREERAYEMADLQAMNAAFASVKMEWADKLPDEPVEYWYDAANYTLIPASDPKPAPCGAGTRRIGGSVRNFERKIGISFLNYHEWESYKGKLPHVTVSKENDELKVSVDWVDA